MKRLNSNYKTSMQRSFVFFSLIPILILLVLCAVFIGAYNFISIEATGRRAGENAMASVLSLYAESAEALDALSINPIIRSFIKKEAPANQAYATLYDKIPRRQSPVVFYLLDSQLHVLASNCPLPLGKEIEPASSYLIEKLQRDTGQVHHDTVFRQYSDKSWCIYSMGKSLLDDGQAVGYLIFEWREKSVEDLLFQANVDAVIITDEYGTALAASNESLLGTLRKFRPELENGRYKTNSTTYSLQTSVAADMPLKVYTLVSLERQQEIYLMLTLFLLASSLVICVMIFLLAKTFSRRNTHSIDELVLALHRFEEGDRDFRINLHTGDEFEYLAEEYNTLLDTVDNLLHSNLELADRERIAEIKQMEAQFNPHFIFNTLESLRYETLMNPQRSSDMIIKLAKLLRYSINHEMHPIAIEKDLWYIAAYLSLQKMRFADRLNYTIDVPPSVAALHIPKLVLQPVVENCIQHGYRNKRSLTIAITARLSNGFVEIRVEDDGEGIPQDTLDRLRQRLDSTENAANHIGLYNVHRRLLLLYGAGSGITIESEERVCTIVTLRFPEKGGSHAESTDC